MLHLAGPLLFASLSLALCEVATASLPRFTDVTSAAGLEFRNWYGNDNTVTILETTGSGAAFFDYDDDGNLDLYIVNGGLGFEGPRFEGFPRDVAPPAAGTAPRNALFRNRGDGSFVDVTAKAGVGRAGWGAGCVAGDYDNDNDRDLYVTYWGPNQFYENEGDGTFADVSARSGTDHSGYGAACAFGDYDNDGDLDLFAGNYVEFDPETTILPGERRGDKIAVTRDVITTAAPELFDPEPDVLYRNEGDGTFADVSAEAGINRELGRALGAVFWDYDGDGDQDLYVANDSSPNFLYTNNGDGTFAEDGARSGVAYDMDGGAEGSMGVAAGDIDNDGDEDLVVANYEVQTASLHRNDGGGAFTNISLNWGVSRTTIMPVQWGTILLDYDRDGDSDLFMANGHITAAFEKHYPQFKYGQRNQLFRNDGDTFVDVSATSGEAMRTARSSRGTAVGDYDNDGDEDLFVVNKNDLPNLLRNDSVNDNHWLTVRTRGIRSNRDGVGARVRVVTGGSAQMREVRAGSSYLSHNSLCVFFGLGAETVVDTLQIRWPSGHTETIADVEGNRAVTVREGDGITSAEP